MRLTFLSLLLGLSIASNLAVAAVASDSTSTVKSSLTKKVLRKKTKLAAKKSSKSKTAALKKKSGGAELSTDVKFDDSVLHGQYQTPDEALAKVEDEKGLSDLLGIRKHFKDRLTTAAEQE